MSSFWGEVTSFVKGLFGVDEELKKALNDANEARFKAEADAKQMEEDKKRAEAGERKAVEDKQKAVAEARAETKKSRIVNSFRQVANSQKLQELQHKYDELQQKLRKATEDPNINKKNQSAADLRTESTELASDSVDILLEINAQKCALAEEAGDKKAQAQYSNEAERLAMIRKYFFSDAVKATKLGFICKCQKDFAEMLGLTDGSSYPRTWFVKALNSFVVAEAPKFKSGQTLRFGEIDQVCDEGPARSLLHSLGSQMGLNSNQTFFSMQKHVSALFVKSEGKNRAKKNTAGTPGGKKRKSPSKQATTPNPKQTKKQKVADSEDDSDDQSESEEYHSDSEDEYFPADSN